jgi:hypothetical protein
LRKARIPGSEDQVFIKEQNPFCKLIDQGFGRKILDGLTFLFQSEGVF